MGRVVRTVTGSALLVVGSLVVGQGCGASAPPAPGSSQDPHGGPSMVTTTAPGSSAAAIHGDASSAAWANRSSGDSGLHGPGDPEPTGRGATTATTEDIVFELPAEGADNGSDCMQRRGFAGRVMGEALAQAAKARCSSDAECGLVSTSTGCAGKCPKAIHTRLHASFAAFQARLKDRACSRYREAGCPYLTPKCVKMEARCVRGACVIKPAN